MNPCPLCGHNDHFYIDTDNNLYYSHGDKDIGKEKGNIIKYLMGVNDWNIDKARDYFIYDIMKQDRQALKTAYKQAKEQENTENQQINNIEKLNLAYLKVDSEKKYSYYMIPKELIDNPVFDSIDYGSKLLYTLMLNRANFSAINKKFIDDNGNIFIIYTLEQIMESMHCSKPSATKMLKQLDKIGLIEKRCQSSGKPSILYVKDFSTFNNANGKIYRKLQKKRTRKKEINFN